VAVALIPAPVAAQLPTYTYRPTPTPVGTVVECHALPTPTRTDHEEALVLCGCESMVRQLPVMKCTFRVGESEFEGAEYPPPPSCPISRDGVWWNLPSYCHGGPEVAQCEALYQQTLLTKKLIERLEAERRKPTPQPDVRCSSHCTKYGFCVSSENSTLWVRCLTPTPRAQP